MLATGAARIEEDERPGGRDRYYNSIEVLDQSGLLPERYDKHHLVPFGEYMPFQIAGSTESASPNLCSFPAVRSPASGTNVLRIPGPPDALAMICYEAIFPNEWGGARDGEAARAAWLLNLTDDAWFGMTAGPYQHFAQARLRAVELGLPLVRVANTGISGIVDARGRYLAACAARERGGARRRFAGRNRRRLGSRAGGRRLLRSCCWHVPYQPRRATQKIDFAKGST